MSTDAALTPLEVATLGSYESVIEQGLAATVEVMSALAQIRDQRLYRAEYDTFAEYCSRRWKLTSRHVNRLIAAAEVIDDVGPIGPKTESQARPLAALPKEERSAAWQEAVETAPRDEDGTPKVTAKHVAATVAKRAAPQDDPTEGAPDHPYSGEISSIEKHDKGLARVMLAWPEILPNGRAEILRIAESYN